MRAVVLAIVLSSGCSDTLTASGFGTFSENTRVVSARAKSGYVNYGGAPLAAWTIDLAERDGCSETTKSFEVEINTLADGSAIPIGSIPVRNTEAPATLPSALVRYDQITITSGSIEMESVTASQLKGSFTVQTANGEVTGEFGAPVCP